MNTLYYAVGGGLGHVTRARRVLDALRIADAAILTSGDVSDDDDVRRAVRAADYLIVDSFPFGIRHELLGISVPRTDHVARRLRNYALDCGGLPPLFHTTYIIEELAPSHKQWISAHSSSIVPLDLSVKPEISTQTDHWLIVHSGPAEEVQELIEYTRELMSRTNETPRVLVATKCDMELPAGFERVAAPAYESAARIISAAGFNVMLETEPWRARHHVVPFPRRFDDQFARAAARRKRERWR